MFFCFFALTGTLDFPSECHQHQAHAPDLHPRSGGHDPTGRSERSRHPPQPADPLQRARHICERPASLPCRSRQNSEQKQEISSSLFVFWSPTDVHGLHPRRGESISAAAHLHSGPDPPLHQQEDRRDGAAHLRHRGQLLLQHEAEQQRPVLHHQVFKLYQRTGRRSSEGEIKTVFCVWQR